MSDRFRSAVLSVGMVFGSAVLVIWIRGDLDPVSLRAETPIQVSDRSSSPNHEYNPDDSPDARLGERHMLLMMEAGFISLPGIVRPANEPADGATTDDNAPVVGVLANGRSRAYCILAMCSPFTHVINDIIVRVPVTVTYCEMTDCIRVFTKPDHLGQALDIGVGGFHDGQMLLHVNHQNLSHNSHQIPLTEMAFERTTWKEWKNAHPDTDIVEPRHTSSRKTPSTAPVALDSERGS